MARSRGLGDVYKRQMLLPEFYFSQVTYTLDFYPKDNIGRNMHPNLFRTFFMENTRYFH
jgi:hypothetical protein